MTRTVPSERLEEVVGGLARAIAEAARKIYWVCPLVAESEMLDIAAAEERYADLRKRFGDKVGLVHGRLPRTGEGCGHGRLRRGRRSRCWYRPR